MISNKGVLVAYFLTMTGWVIHWFFKSSNLNSNVLLLVFILVCPLVGTAISTYNNTALQRQIIPSYRNVTIQERIRATRILLFLGVILSVAGLIFVIKKP